MLASKITNRYTVKEKKANVLTHFIGLLLSIIGAPIIIYLAWKNHSYVQIIAVIIYCLTMMNTYLSSTLYHKEKNQGKKLKYRIYDHISIYFLIGGTYTPFILVFYNEPAGHWFLLIHWLIIAVAILFKIFFTGRFEFVSVASYLFLGWMFVFIFESMIMNMNSVSFKFLIAGGLSYTLGVLFYVWHKIPYHHAIWHVFVIGGSLGHYLSLCYALS